jgi:hypothetical protein
MTSSALGGGRENQAKTVEYKKGGIAASSTSSSIKSWPPLIQSYSLRCKAARVSGWMQYEIHFVEQAQLTYSVLCCLCKNTPKAKGDHKDCTKTLILSSILSLLLQCCVHRFFYPHCRHLPRESGERADGQTDKLTDDDDFKGKVDCRQSVYCALLSVQLIRN